MNGTEPRTGVLLINLGTPDSPSVADVRRYLREFLMDPRVIDIPGFARWMLVNLIILPTRPQKSAAAYRSIWSSEGSPLLAHERALTAAVQERLGPRFAVELGMRYGSPSIQSAIEKLLGAGVGKIVALPLFPQYASASTGSAVERVLDVTGSKWNVPPLTVIGAFYEHPGFIGSFFDVAKPALERFRPDHTLFSYHGLPERQIKKSDPTGAHCLAFGSCCDAIVDANRNCYRAQCFATTRALATRLGLSTDQHSVSFQSRLGRTPWIQPHTDVVLPELAKKAVRRLAILCPAFVADCLETVEEIGIRAKAQWQSLGGDALALVPSLNAHPSWVETVAGMIRAVAMMLLIAVVTTGCAGANRSGPTSRPHGTEAASARGSSAVARAELIPAGAGEILDRVKRSTRRVVILNLWATWCEPCKEELPDFLRLLDGYKDVDLVLVSTDFDSEQPAAVRFLTERGVDFPSYIKQGADMEFIDRLEPRWSGALPATLVYRDGGKLVQFLEGRVSYEMLERLVRGVLNSPPS